MSHRASSLIGWVFVLAGLLIIRSGRARADFSADPPYGSAALHFAELERQYAATTPAVVLYDRQRSEIHFSTDLFTRQYRDIMYAVFDARSAGDALDQAFLVPRGVKVKSLRAWSYAPGAAGLVWSKDSDSRTTKRVFDLKDVRVAVPGLAGKGLCGVRLELEWDGLNYIAAEFGSPYPIRLAEATVSVEHVGNTSYADDPTALIARYFAWMIRGKQVGDHTNVDDTPPQPVAGKYGPEWRWTFKDLPARTPEALARAQDTDPVGFYLVPRDASWDGIQLAGDEILRRVKLPAGYLKGGRDALKDLARGGAPPDSAVTAVARLLDNPRHFTLLGEPRSSLRQASTTFAPLPDGRLEGTPFDKAIVAGLLLEEVGVKSFLTLGASRYGEALDLKIPNINQFDAVLLRIPGAGENYLWDVADRRVPLGLPGPELYTIFLVLDPEADDPVALFEPPAGRVSESRSFRVTSTAAHGMTGTLSWRCSGPPSLGLDPWGDGENLVTDLNDAWKSQARIDSARWQVSGSDFRAGGDARVELAAAFSGSVEATGDEQLDLVLDVPGLPADLFEAAEPSTRRHSLYLARGYDLADTIRVESPGVRWIGATSPLEMSNAAGRFSQHKTESPEGLVLVRRISLTARLTNPEEYALYRNLIHAWRRSEAEPLVIRPAKS